MAIGVLGLLAVSATALFFAAIRGGGKVDVGTNVRQNGQFALSSMQQLTRNALSIDTCVLAPSSSLTMTARDGGQLTFSCQDIGLETGHIASNSARLTAQDVVVTACSFTCDAGPNNIRGPLVTISFTVRQAGTSGAVSESATVDFSTAVSLRSY